MNTVGFLCYKYGGDALCFKYHADELIYKAEPPPAQCTISVQYGNQSWVCNTYRCYHEIIYNCAGTGTNVVTTSSDIGFATAEFIVEPSANGTFTVTVTASTNCAALDIESPNATCTIAASQPGATPKIKLNIALRPNSTVSAATISFDAEGKLSGIY